MRLGPKQLKLLQFIGTRGALVVGDKMSRRLCDLGLLISEPDGSFARITPDGLRSLADALEAGRISLWSPTPRTPNE
jgi:hypothetical protein